MTTQVKPLSGKIALVTGGSRGIGRAICNELADRGADICFNYLRNHTAARSVVSELETRGISAMRHRANLADEAAIEGLIIAAVERFGKIDIVDQQCRVGRDAIIARIDRETLGLDTCDQCEGSLARRDLGVRTHAGRF